jgi:hypothetical protein
MKKTRNHIIISESVADSLYRRYLPIACQEYNNPHSLIPYTKHTLAREPSYYNLHRTNYDKVIWVSDKKYLTAIVKLFYGLINN